MSYDVRLCDPVSGETLTLERAHAMAGGTYQAGGTRELWHNVTHNYAPALKKALGEKGIRELYGMSGAESVALLERGAEALADDATDDYWEPTEGNAKRALLALLAMARLRPDGVWAGD